jgi:hypothetical protein
MAWIALAIAATLVYRSEQHIRPLTSALRTFDHHAREAASALVEARVAQQAYVAEGQGIGFWMAKVTSSTDATQAALAAMRESMTAAGQTAMDQATAATAEFGAVEARVRDYLKSGQLLMAGDVIFTEGNAAAATAAQQIEAASQAEHQSYDAELAVLRKQEAIAAGAGAGVAALVVLLLIPAGRRSTRTRDEIPSTETAPTPAAAPPPAPQPAQSSSALVKLAAALSTEFGRVRDLDELKRVLARAAEAMDASGMMVWMAAPGGGDLRLMLAHGYSADVLARSPPVPRSADNAAAAAFRSGTLRIVLARPGGANGAVVAPILAASGCIGALSAEIRHRAETSEAVQALAEIAAAHLASVLAQAPEDVSTPKAAAQG